jgi:putative ABC transport system substrate-binding protein
MRRREFLGVAGGASIAWPFAPQAQQAGRMRHVGALMPGAEGDPDEHARLQVFQKTLGELGWTVGQNVRIQIRQAGGRADRFQSYAAELVAASPDVLVADATPSTAALQRETRIIPIVFVRVTDPLGQGFVSDVARPGGNITGFSNYEPAMGGKWLDLLKEAVPHIERVALIYNPLTAPYTPSFLPTFETAARARGLTLVDVPVRNVDELKAAIATQGRESGVGAILQTDTFLVVHRNVVAAWATRHRLPTISPVRVFAASGCLLSYGVKINSMYQGAATYVDRILRGSKAAELAVQWPTEFELVINLKTAKALSLTIPPTVLARADEVIE